MLVSGSASRIIAPSSVPEGATVGSAAANSSLIKSALDRVSEAFEALEARLFTKAGAAALVIFGMVALLRYQPSILTSVANSVSSLFGRTIHPNSGQAGFAIPSDSLPRVNNAHSGKQTQQSQITPVDPI